MNLSRIVVSLLLAIVGLVAVTAADDPLLRADRPMIDPRGKEFKRIKVYYNPKGKSGEKCWFYYQLKGEDEGTTIYFDNDDIDESSDKVVCKKKEEEKDGIDLPVNEDVDLNYATWVGEVPRDADVRWKKESGKPMLTVQIKKIYDWEAVYDPDGEKDKKCYLKYKYKSDETTKVYFRDNFVNERGDNRVVCKKKDFDDFPEGLSKVYKDLSDYSKWVGEKVKEADVLWEKDDDGNLVLTIKKVDDGDGPQDVKYQGYYNPKADKNEKCYLKYSVDGGDDYYVRYRDSEIKKDGDKVYCERKQNPRGGLKLPVDDDITDDTEWKGEEVKYANVKWRKDNKYVKFTIEKEEEEEKDIKYKGYYNPDGRKDRKCYLKYFIDDEEFTVRFSDDDITKDGDSVYCERKKRPEGGIKLPVDEDITDETTWKGEEVEYANLKWSKDKYRIRLKIEREKSDPKKVEWEGYYNPNAKKNKKCYVKYSVDGGDYYYVRYRDSDIEKDGSKVYCERKQNPRGGLELPVDEDITDETTWKGEDVKYANVDWSKSSKKVKFTIEREKDDEPPDWEAYYNPDGRKDRKCWAKYSIGDEEYRIRFADDDIEQDGNNKVYCERKKRPQGGLKLPVDEDITENTEWKDEEIKSAYLRWKENEYVKVTITKKRGGGDTPDEVEWKAFYDPDGPEDRKCYLRYVVGDKTFKFYFDDDDVKERIRNRKVICATDDAGEPKGKVELPVTQDIDAHWEGQTVDDADMAWLKNGKLRVTIESD